MKKDYSPPPPPGVAGNRSGRAEDTEKTSVVQADHPDS